MQIRFDEIPVPEDKLNAVVGRNMQKVRNVYKRRQKRKNLVRWASAAAAVVLITVFCFTNPLQIITAVRRKELQLRCRRFTVIKKQCMFLPW